MIVQGNIVINTRDGDDLINLFPSLSNSGNCTSRKLHFKRQQESQLIDHSREQWKDPEIMWACLTHEANQVA